MNYEGTIYRPPSEARSLILQVTIGCRHNQCTFCTMYKEKQFRIRSRKEIFRDLEEMSVLYGHLPLRIFLADGDALALDTELLVHILQKIRSLFPYCRRVTVYGTAADILNKSAEELLLLRDAGLSMVYVGAESGDDIILKNVRKGLNAEQIIHASNILKTAGIQLSLTLISGLGGRGRLTEHALASAKLITEIKPEYLGFLTLLLKSGAPMLKDIEEGRMELLLPHEILWEMRLFLEHVDSENTVFRANHPSNYVNLKGTLNQDIHKMLKQIDEAGKREGYRPEGWRAL